ncbi:uncharacterized protein [Drosophila virilis]|uniref:Uncharacterized protein n=1 Tax=Drosophila virilis TaxID=7244 RepID=B4M259_DROVI|nr:uncharacterized protein LOC6631620 [Drosophila virilis]EDW65763.1 uncharacterized protein Dvir_GJ18719 [Drosophila virilis]
MMMAHILMLPMLLLCIGQLQAAPIICGTDGQASVKTSEESGATPRPSEVNQFLHNVQCTLEKAKPWIEDLETEAKRLEETAKRVGLSIVHRFGNLIDTLLGAVANRPPSAGADATQATTPMTLSENTDSNVTAPINVELAQVTHSAEPPLSSPAPNEEENEIINIELLK